MTITEENRTLQKSYLTQPNLVNFIFCKASFALTLQIYYFKQYD